MTHPGRLSRSQLLALDGYLSSRTYLTGAAAGRLDSEARALVPSADLSEETPHLRRWHAHLASYTPAELSAPPPAGQTLEAVLRIGGDEARAQVHTC